ncbi:MAG TPA: PIG-L family deacetylase [Ktedonobacterales bacterium]|nr:PIG-L family deacetylase [Ktedonobacterales bacterium]
MNALKLMAIVAHPDDESLGFGGTLAAYAAEGVETYLVTATRGERGWTGDPRECPGLAALGAIREAELRAAATVLGVRSVALLDYVDGDLNQAPPDEVVGKLVTQLRRVRPQVVLTFDPFGAYGHPDHIAISQFTAAAIVAAADPSSPHARGLAPHAVAKLYYMATSARRAEAYQAAFGELVMNVGGVERRMHNWPDWAITTRIDTAASWQTVWHAVLCHQSQLPNYAVLEHLPEQDHIRLWGLQEFYRVVSQVHVGSDPEVDVFAGLR